MTRHFDFRNDGDATLGSIFHQVAEFILGIVTTLGTLAALLQILVATGIPVFPQLTRTPGCKVVESRIALDFNAPSCSISQMDMETVELILRHHINLFLEEGDREIMTRNIEHQATPLVGRCIHDVAACDALLGSKLLHGLPGTEETLAAGGTDFNGIRCHMKPVCLWRRGIGELGKLHHSLGCIIHLDIPCLGIDILGISAYLVFYFHTVAGVEYALAHRNLLWFRQQILSLKGRG